MSGEFVKLFGSLYKFLERNKSDVSEKTIKQYATNIRRILVGLRNDGYKINDGQWSFDIIIKHYKHIINFINDQESFNTRKSLMSSIYTVSLLYGRKRYGKWLDKIKNDFDRFRKEETTIMKQQKTTVKEDNNWISYDTLREKANKIYRKCVKYNKIDEIDLLLMLFILHPPRRAMDYSCVKIVDAGMKMKSDENNYYHKKKHYFVFNVYKTADRYGPQIIHVISKRMRYMLDVFLKKKKKRKYLFGDHDALEKETISKRLQRILREYFDRGYINILRHSYIEQFYKVRPSPTILEKENLAYMMGHSRELQEFYRRPNAREPSIRKA
jgi:hypothetical protein